jgi:glucose uptake protein GlcU
VVPITDQLFTAINIGSVGVATGAVTLVPAALDQLADLTSKTLKRIAFGTSLGIAYLVVFMSSNPQWYDWGFAFLNACLLFCAANGVNRLASKSSKEKGVIETAGFFKSWQEE